MSHSLAAIAWLIDAYPALQISTQPSHKTINPLAPMTSIDIIQTLCTFRASHYYRKCHRWALDNLGPSFGHNLKKFVRFRHASPTKSHLGGGGASPFICRGGRRCNSLGELRRAFGAQVFKKACTLMATTQSQSSLVEVLHENQSNLYFDPRLLGCWVVMNIINGIAREGSLCALVPPSLAPEEQTLWERNNCKCGMC